MEHRRTPSRKAFVPPGWFIAATVVAILAGVGGLGWLLVDDLRGDDDPAPSAGSTASASATTPEPTPEPTPSETTPSPEPEPTETTPEPEETEPEPEVVRDVAVSVLNNTGVSGAAAAFSGRVQQAGWTIGGVGNWRGQIGGNTVYYPPGFEAQAQLLAEDVGIPRVRERLAPMRADRLTIILSGPQQ